MKKYLTTLSVLAMILASFALISSALAATPQNAEYLSSTGTIYLSSGSSIAEAVSAPNDGDFIQMGAGSTITLKFPGDYVAAPDGTPAADLRVDIYDALFPANAEVFVSLNGTTWTSVGVYSDTANIDLDLEATGPVKYVKIDQNGYSIDPAYPDLGFDLDAVVALNAVEDKCPGIVADHWTSDQLGVNRYMWDGSKWLTKTPKLKTVVATDTTMAYTYSCSCTQILDSMKATTGFDFGGHYKYGCSKSILEDWNRGTYYIGPTWIETVTVPADSATAVYSTNVLETGNNYFLKASGTADAGDGIEFDAKYSFRTGSSVDWTDAVSTYEYLGPQLLDLYVDSNNVDWGVYNSGHIYQIPYAGTGSTASFLINDSYPVNNTGSLSVDIIEDKWVDLW